ncbi:MAG: DNA-binding protein [Lachnospiraceae bacterium]|nr:DNA-binding protein [Lachnospiraceae bacterium]
MELLTTAEIAEKWGISRRRVSLLCAEGRIQGAVQKSKMWLVPADTKKPEDPRKERKNATRG